jgi:hypothetical protein
LLSRPIAILLIGHSGFRCNIAPAVAPTNFHAPSGFNFCP